MNKLKRWIATKTRVYNDSVRLRPTRGIDPSPHAENPELRSAVLDNMAHSPVNHGPAAGVWRIKSGYLVGANNNGHNGSNGLVFCATPADVSAEITRALTLQALDRSAKYDPNGPSTGVAASSNY